MSRRAAGLLIALLVASTTTGVSHSQQPSATNRNTRVYYGTIVDREVLFNLYDETPLRRPVRYFSDVRVGFSYTAVDDPTHPSGVRWTSRQIWWRGVASSSSSITGWDCQGEGRVDLGPAQGHDELTAAQHDSMRIPCKFWDKATNWAHITLPNPKVSLPKIDTNMPTCGPGRHWTENGVQYSLDVVGGDPKGAFRVDKLDTAPSPGATYKITGWSNMLGRWRFVVDSSRLRGYATNADVDRLFFYLHPNVRHFGNTYRTLDPDLIFDPRLATEDRSEWKMPYPESGRRKWTRLESTDDTSVSRVEADLTAMDYGAHGELRAFFSPSCGNGSSGGWIAVPVEGDASGVVKVPTDADGNFIADLGHRFDDVLRDVPPLTDDDAEPKGDGTPGDGFSAFEEYRGFILAEGCAGDPPLSIHMRTDPKKKDLFVHASTWLGYVLQDFGFVSGLQVHPICAPQYADDQTRVVNFTMHSISGPAALGEGLRGARLTQERPQHGLRLLEQPIGNGVLGQSFGFGPPENVERVAVDVRAIIDAYSGDWKRYLTLIAIHELGHAVGIRHHGDGNMVGPVVLLSTPGCIVGMTEGTADGRSACQVEGIAIRGQQNSGNALCPMKYIQWSWYVPRGSSLTYSHLVDFRPDTTTTWSWRRPARRLPGYDGPVQRYRRDLDGPPSVDQLKFCTLTTGTGINALPMDLNHAGDGSRSVCAGQLRVNDVPTGSGTSR